MLSYVKTHVTSSDYITDNIVNDNSREFINSLRVVDDIQLPVENILSQSLFVPELGFYDSDRSGAHTDTRGFIAPSQAIFVTSGTIEDLTGWTRDVTDPPATGTTVATFGPPSVSYDTFGQVSPFVNINNIYIRGSFMRIPCREGMLHCEWTGDIEVPLIRILYTDNNQDQPASRGADWTYNVGMYVDGVLVSHSGDLPWGCRKLVHLDCSVPIGEKEVEVEVKWQAKIDRNDYRILAEEFTITSQMTPTMNVFNMQLMSRNQYR